MRAAPALLLLLAACVAPPRGDALDQVDATLDALHAAAARADGPAYFALFAPRATFIGTDPGEHWDLAAFTQAVAEEAAASGVLVNAVAPSIMDTPVNRAAMPKADASRWPKTSEVADVIAWLASPGNRVVRGALVTVPGRS